MCFVSPHRSTAAHFDIGESMMARMVSSIVRVKVSSPPALNESARLLSRLFATIGPRTTDRSASRKKIRSWYLRKKKKRGRRTQQTLRDFWASRRALASSSISSQEAVVSPSKSAFAELSSSSKRCVACLHLDYPPARCPVFPPTCIRK